MSTETPPRFHRSEAFAEDLDGFVAEPPQRMTERRWLALASWLPVGVVLLSLVFVVA
jgi:hypothetical protein